MGLKTKWFKFREKIENAHILTPETYKAFDEFENKLKQTLKKFEKV